MSTFNRLYTRRRFFASGSLLSALVGISGERVRASPEPGTKRGRNEPHIYRKLGVRTIINAKGTYTYLTGSLMPQEVVQAMEEASRHFVDLNELQHAVGAKIAQLLGAEAACVTSGAAGAIVLGTAACVTGNEPEKIKRLPDTDGMKNEVIIQKQHRNVYDHAIRSVGVRLVEIETEEELERAASGRTAMMFFLNAAQNQGKIGLERWVSLGKQHGVPTFNDAAADVPPASHLTDYIRTGFDLVTFSGGKALRGPQCAGLLIGRKDLIEAALLNTNPNADTIGRPMKVGKEEMLGMLVALERYLKLDQEAERRALESRLLTIEKAVSSIPGIRTGRFLPEVANHFPHLYIQWDEAALGLTKAECTRRLREGDQSIEVLEDFPPYGMSLTSFTLKPGEEKIVAHRLREILEEARKKSQRA